MKRSGFINVDGALVEAHHLWFVREELRAYPRRRQRLAFLEKSIVHETLPNETPGIQSGKTSNPTEGRVMALLQDQEVAWLRPRVDWVERNLAKLDPITRQVVDLMVIKGTHTAAGVKLQVRCLSEAGVYRELNRALLLFAIDLWGEQVIVKGRMPRRVVRMVSGDSVEVEN